MFNESIVKKTRQWWKANILFWGVVIGGAILFLGLANLEVKELAFTLMLVGIFVGIVSFIFGCVSIRCPNCNAPWVWQGVSGKSHNEWIRWLLNQSECPNCKQ